MSLHVVSQIFACCKSAILKATTNNSTFELSQVIPIVLTVWVSIQLGFLVVYKLTWGHTVDWRVENKSRRKTLLKTMLQQRFDCHSQNLKGEIRTHGLVPEWWRPNLANENYWTTVSCFVLPQQHLASESLEGKSFQISPRSQIAAQGSCRNSSRLRWNQDLPHSQWGGSQE